jgi:hypothetical protein
MTSIVLWDVVVYDTHVLARMFAGAMGGWMDLFSLYSFGMDRLAVTFTHSFYFILCLSISVGTRVNFVATDSVYPLLWERVFTL